MSNEQKITTDYYNENAALWTAKKTDSFFNEAEFRTFISYLNEGDTVLDIGCAGGVHIPMFLGIGGNLHYEGFDISTGLVKIAKSRYPQLSITVGDILDRATLPNKKYDGFWAVAILMHVHEEDWDMMLGNIEKLCVPGAVGYLTLPNRRPNLASDEDRRLFTILTVERVHEMLSERGWKILKEGPVQKDQTGVWQGYLVRLP
ncbi:class I SAM-dependent methyltransferase [Patescibacteria group bacterium]|nr:class I SAM-dependent methyltransferase [Patescibacteria group bacterium]MBU1755263.1 class I SAM-dependent methyltransferase [Patescibacteria group bacterium]